MPYRKGAGVFVPPGTASGPIAAGDVDAERPTAEIPVKAHVRTVPAKPAPEKSLLPESITLELLVAEFGKAQRGTTHEVLLLGALCEFWIREQLAKRTALDRATAIKKIREELAAAKLEKKEARVDLFIRCYWVATLLGGWRADNKDSRVAARQVAFSTLRLFPVLIERHGDRWQLVPRYAEAAKALWARTIAEKLSVQTVDQEISKILPARIVSLKKHRPVRLGTIARLLARLKPADLLRVPELVTELRAKRTEAA
ncbi:MAG: hypothetical protein WAV76_09880 [Bacteroidota bacterium]